MASDVSTNRLGICDAHHHLWDLQRIHYPWLATKGIKRFFGDPTPIQVNYLPANLRADAGDVFIEKSVHIQVGTEPSQSVEESAFVQEMVDTTGLPSAIVAYCDLEKETLEIELERHQRYSSLRGVRQIVGRSPKEDRVTGSGKLLENSQWQWGLLELTKRHLRFDLQLIPDQMDAAFKVLSKVEDLPVALCHAGSPWYRDEAGWALWQQGLQRFSQLPNFFCKISGLGMFDPQWTVESLRPVVDTVLEIFGPQRCMFGSNFPVDKLYRGYGEYWQAYEELTESYSDSEKRMLFRETCEQFYNI